MTDSSGVDDETAFQFQLDGAPEDQLRVLAFEGVEELSRAYVFDVLIQASVGNDGDIERIALGQRGVFRWKLGEQRRVFHCVVRAVTMAGHDPTTGSTRYQLRLAPRLWLLGKKKRSRVFQKMRVPDVVTIVLLEAGIATRWKLTRSYPVREYCTQYEETDLDFVTRLLAEAGIFFYFPQVDDPGSGGATGAQAAAALGSLGATAAGMLAGAEAAAAAAAAASAAAPLLPGDSLVCADSSAGYPPMGGDDLLALAATNAASFVASAGQVAADAAGVPGGGAAVAGATTAATSAFASPAKAPALHYLEVGDAGSRSASADRMSHFEPRTTLRSNAGRFREYDPIRPMAKLETTALSNDPFPLSGLERAAAELAKVGDGIAGSSSGIVATVGQAASSYAAVAASAIEGVLGEGRPPLLETYEHHGPFLFPKWSFASDEASLLMRQKRRRAWIADGESGCGLVGAGHRFVLDGHPIARFDTEYVATRVRHVGRRAPQLKVLGRPRGRARDGSRERARGAETAFSIYENQLEATLATVAFVPPRPVRRSVQVALTATVVGSAEEEIHTTEMAQIRVQFHWDREGTLDEKSSCWIRTMHPWAGASWGAQFIPRVGMEVVVVFEGGDVDKPIVLGCLYNGTHPAPFALPGDKTRSGVRTQSSLGGGGFNELSFQDLAGKEQVYLHAQKNHDEVVGHDHSSLVKHDEVLHVLGRRLDRIEKELESYVGGDRRSTVAGNSIDAVSGDSDVRVTGTLTTRLESRERREVQAAADLVFKDDHTLRVHGSSTTIVGNNDAHRTWTTHAEGVAMLTGTDGVVIRSDKSITLMVGKSIVRISEDRIELTSPTIAGTGEGGGLTVDGDGVAMKTKDDVRIVLDKGVTMKTPAASIAMGTQIKADAPQILLNSPEQATDPKSKDPEPPTTIELVDQDGAALPFQRFIIRTDDDAEIGGQTGKDGKATLELASGGKIAFPDVTMSGDAASRDMQPIVVQQGDYLERLASRHGFDPDEVWKDAKNSELTRIRDRRILLPGDVLHVPTKKQAGETLSKGTSNRYTVKVPVVDLDIGFTDAEGKPMANAAYVLEGLGAPVQGSTDGDGRLKTKIPATVREVVAVFATPDDGADALGGSALAGAGPLRFVIRVGDMDPDDTPSGVRKRLQHLGYLSSVPDFSESDQAEADRRAIANFQADHGLEATGEADDATRDKLVEVHGS